MTTYTYRQIPDLVAKREPFQGNSMRAERVPPGRWVRTGYLPEDERAMLAHARHDADYFGEELYVVYSYGTPIAWGLDGRDLYVPDVKYSVTTSKQQSIVRREARA